MKNFQTEQLYEMLPISYELLFLISSILIYSMTLILVHQPSVVKLVLIYVVKNYFFYTRMLSSVKLKTIQTCKITSTHKERLRLLQAKCSNNPHIFQFTAYFLNIWLLENHDQQRAFEKLLFSFIALRKFQANSSTLLEISVKLAQC